MLIYKLHICGRASTYGYLVDKTLCYTLFDTDAYKAMLNKKFYDEHLILHHYSNYPKDVQPIQVANDQFMAVKEAIKFFISFGGHTFEIIAYFYHSLQLLILFLD